jgi:hypothetical protein
MPSLNVTVITSAVALEQFGYFGFTAYMMYMILVADGPNKTAHYAIAPGSWRWDDASRNVVAHPGSPDKVFFRGHTVHDSGLRRSALVRIPELSEKAGRVNRGGAGRRTRPAGSTENGSYTNQRSQCSSHTGKRAPGDAGLPAFQSSEDLPLAGDAEATPPADAVAVDSMPLNDARNRAKLEGSRHVITQEPRSRLASLP